MELSIIIINWQSSYHVKQCLKSIYDNLHDLSFETIVVDNASFDDCKDMVGTEFPQVKFVQSKENIGFARGNNLGFSHSTGDVLLFLNPDTKVIGPAINVMYSALESTRDAGIVGCKILNPDLSVQTSCIQPYPTLLNQLIDTDYLKQLFPNWKIWGIRPLLYGNASPEEIQAVSGACIMIKRSVFEKVGQFSSDYFMYTEDLDLCYKTHKAGWKIYYVGGGEIIHYGGQSASKKTENWFSVIVMRESILRYFVKMKGRFCGWLYRMTTMAVAVLRILVLAVTLVLIQKRSRQAELKYSFDKWVKILRWSVGMEKWASELDRSLPARQA